MCIRDRLNRDLRDAYQSYKLGMTDKETYLEQKKAYEHLLCLLYTSLECGILAGKMPGVDMISFGPTLESVHTPDECMDVASVCLLYTSKTTVILWQLPQKSGQNYRILHHR